MKQTYWVFWTYVANFSERWLECQATDPADAARQLYKMYPGPEFREKATVHVSTTKPFTVKKGTVLG